ncbi:hypothetical protein OHS33_20135 [Streptomyces sp. NBC_00536]|uniref:hypothetical protein n=1 Tax=Streptomyces sp. NBC_00536 TaxID=2975769 RepID=UPI002E7FD37A|nr:hypothetical protein [Streptomyces sp. NBC_00536]WUC80427.1 hypothetical protein OHS33_20135 [Streptomyces sp. NBC_00536]
MGIESDHLVYEYLSRVGDLAQRRQLPSSDRMRLVTGLRDEIDRRRAKYDPDTPAAVRRILDRIGSPEEILDALASGRGPGAAAAPEAAVGVPEQRGPGRLRGRKSVPPPRTAPSPAPPPAPGPASPHLAGLDELGPDGGGSAEPDWWRVTPGPYGAGPQVEGFAGGIEMPDLPDLFKVPAEEDEAAEADAVGAGRDGSRGRAVVRALRERRRRKKEAAAPDVAVAEAARPKPHAFLLLAALLLTVGAVSGYWVLLGLGWLVAYASRVLGPAEKKWVVFGLPGAVFAGAVVWVWGRLNHHWGDPLVDGQLGEAFSGMWPWLVRGAAVASALYLGWRSRRRA